MPAVTLDTIGYEGLRLGGFPGLLTAHGIESIGDIRDLPLSRKPGLSRTSLAAAVNALRATAGSSRACLLC